MDCDRCPADAVTRLAYSGLHLCGAHFRRSVESRVRSRVRDDALVPPDATPEDPVTWLVGLSGGKDSVVLTTVLHETFRTDPRVELVALTIHEGIAGYRDASLDACLELTAALDIGHEVVSYAEEFGLEMDDVARQDPEGMAPCAYCGVFRRDLLSASADDLDADLLLTGHNLDDEAQTALMNLLSGDVSRMARHWEASLGPLDERAGTDEAAPRDTDGPFVPRAKPLRDVPEKEVALYAHLRDLPTHMAECPHASEAYRAEVRDHLLALEDDHPGTRHSVMSGYEELARLAAAARERGAERVGDCERCGAPTAREVCRKCSLVTSVHEAGAGLEDGDPTERDADAD